MTDSWSSNACDGVEDKIGGTGQPTIPTSNTVRTLRPGLHFRLSDFGRRGGGGGHKIALQPYACLTLNQACCSKRVALRTRAVRMVCDAASCLQLTAAPDSESCRTRGPVELLSHRIAVLCVTDETRIAIE